MNPPNCVRSHLLGLFIEIRVFGSKELLAVHCGPEHWHAEKLGAARSVRYDNGLSSIRFSSTHSPENPDLTAIPSAIGDIRSLEYFNVSGCRLTTLPKELFYNVHLKEINASKNKIAVVPVEIGHCKGLVRLKFVVNIFIFSDHLGKSVFPE